MTREFIQKAEEAEPVGIIAEGTNITGAHFSSEPEVERKLTRIIGQASGLVLADFARADVDRFRSFYQAARKNDRKLAITLKQAYLLKKLSKDPYLALPHLNNKRVLIFQKEKKRYYKWEQEVLDFENVVDSSRIAEIQDRVILVSSFYDLEELIDINPVPGSCQILSASEPFNEEMEIDFNRLINWLEHYGLPQYHVHISGHIMPLHLRDALQAINAKMIYPVHGEHQELFCRFMAGLDSKTLAVERGKEYSI